MTEELFLKWFQRFVKFAGASKEIPILIILNGHKTHNKNVELIDFALENGVVLLCLPPHYSHRLQPLDVAFCEGSRGNDSLFFKYSVLSLYFYTSVGQSILGEIASNAVRILKKCCIGI